MFFLSFSFTTFLDHCPWGRISQHSWMCMRLWLLCGYVVRHQDSIILRWWSEIRLFCHVQNVWTTGRKPFTSQRGYKKPPTLCARTAVCDLHVRVHVTCTLLPLVYKTSTRPCSNCLTSIDHYLINVSLIQHLWCSSITLQGHHAAWLKFPRSYQSVIDRVLIHLMLGGLYRRHGLCSWFRTVDVLDLKCFVCVCE